MFMYLVYKMKQRFRELMCLALVHSSTHSRARVGIWAPDLARALSISELCGLSVSEWKRSLKITDRP